MLKTLCLIIPLALAGSAAAQFGEEAGKTLSPYFFVKSDDPALDQLPLKSTAAVVDIAGVIADVKVTQLYKNEGKKPLEATYIFPASTRAAVYGMKMTIGDRTIVAQIGKRAAARQEYEKAIREGKSASLLEQQRPNVFQMNVGNLLPGDEIKVELSYTELLIPTDGVYEFVYPTVVGPRYSNKSEAPAPANDKWVKNPYFKEGKAPSYTFNLTTNLSAGMPIQEVMCTSHKVDVSYENQTRAFVKLDATESTGGNRDFVLRYRLAGAGIVSGLLLHQEKDENFFLLMLQPPKRVATSQIPPREYIFIVDVSGSMHGFPLDISKSLMRNLIGALRPQDKFNVLLFAGSASVLAEESLPATPENLKRALRVIDQQQGGGGTELLPALERALALPHSQGASRTVVIATDGYVSVETEAFDLVRNRLGDANFFAFGIGTSVNRHLIEGLARVGMGEPFVITKLEEAETEAEKFRRYIQTPVLTNVDVDFGGFNAYAVEPPAIPDVLAERPVIIFGKWRGEARGKIKLTGSTGAQPYSATIDASSAASNKPNSALRYLWARHRVALLADYANLKSGDELVGEVTNLGLQYNLLTAYTSFVAVDSKVRSDGKVTTVEQPLPLPQGVSDYAVGGVPMMSSRAMAPASLGKISNMTFSQSAEVAEPAAKKVELQAQAAEIRIDHIVATAGITTYLAQSTIKSRLGEIRTCYETALQAQPALRGKIVMRFVLDARGYVTEVKMISNGAGDPNLARCMMEKMKQWRFAGVQQKGEIEVTFVLAQ